MQEGLKDIVADIANAIELPDPIVEFGAMQVEENQDGDLRPLFPDRDFTGTDYRDGPGVDRVEDLRHLTFGDESVGTSLCLDTLEHCADPPQACREMARVTAPGGVCVITSVMAFGIHAYPSDYFRFTPEGFRVMLQDGGFDQVDACGIAHPEFPYVVVGIGVKQPNTLSFKLADLPSIERFQRNFDEAKGKVRIGTLTYPPKLLISAMLKDAPRLLRERVRSR